MENHLYIVTVGYFIFSPAPASLGGSAQQTAGLPRQPFKCHAVQKIKQRNLLESQNQQKEDKLNSDSANQQQKLLHKQKSKHATEKALNSHTEAKNCSHLHWAGSRLRRYLN